MTSVGVMASAVHIPVASGVDVLMEPFNNFTTNGWAVNGGTIVTGRTGNGAQITGGASGPTFTIPAGNVSDTNTVGFAYKTSHVNPPHDIMSFMRSGAHENRVILTATGAVSVSRGSTGIGVSGNVITATNTWYYFELQVYSHDTAGTVTVRVNGVTVLSLTGIDTHDFGQTNQLQLREAVGATNTYDDLYLTTGAGAPFKGDITVP